jgi:hypothetical protein
MEMNLKINAGNIIIEGIGLKELLQQVYEQGKRDGTNSYDIDELVSFQQIQEELSNKNVNISVKTLIRKARNAKVKLLPYDGKRLAVAKRDISRFISGY